MDSWNELAEQAERVEGGPTGFQEEKRRSAFIEKAGARSDRAQKVDLYKLFVRFIPAEGSARIQNKFPFERMQSRVETPPGLVVHF
jgi:hypothetical protein